MFLWYSRTRRGRRIDKDRARWTERQSGREREIKRSGRGISIHSNRLGGERPSRGIEENAEEQERKKERKELADSGKSERFLEMDGKKKRRERREEEEYRAAEEL